MVVDAQISLGLCIRYSLDPAQAALQEVKGHCRIEHGDEVSEEVRHWAGWDLLVRERPPQRLCKQSVHNAQGAAMMRSASADIPESHQHRA